MSIRIICLPGDAEAALRLLRASFGVIAVHGPYPCRGDDQRVRLYLEVQS